MDTSETKTKNPLHDLLQNSLALTALGTLSIAAFFIVEPFLGAVVWAAMIVIATWPMMKRIESLLGGSRTLATMVMTISLLLVLFIPMWFAIYSIAINVDVIRGWFEVAVSSKLPTIPEWMKSIPFIGPKLTMHLENLRNADRSEIVSRVTPYVGRVGAWLVSQIGNLGLLLLHFLLTIIISTVLYLRGEVAASGALRFAEKLAGTQGHQAAVLAARAVRAVALGILVTALVQSAIACIGLVAVSVPYATLLSALIFILCVAQIGPVPVMLPAIIWLHYQGWTTSFGFMIVWTVGLLIIDNAIRPILIKKGADLPLLLVFAGVTGGLISYGIIGLFVGPVILAVVYTLLTAWVQDGEPPAGVEPQDPLTDTPAPALQEA